MLPVTIMFGLYAENLVTLVPSPWDFGCDAATADIPAMTLPVQ